MKKYLLVIILSFIATTGFAKCLALTSIQFQNYDMDYCLSTQSGTLAAKKAFSSSMIHFVKKTADTYAISKNRRHIDYTGLSTQNYAKLKYILIQASI